MSKTGTYVMGVLSGILLVVAAVLLISWLPTPGDPDSRKSEWARQHVLEREKEFGADCEHVSSRASSFIQGPLGQILEAGRRGEDWVLKANRSHETEIRWLREKTFQCSLTNGPRETARMATDPLVAAKSRLFQALDVYITPYGDTPASARSLKPEAFQEIERLAVELLSRTSASR